MSSPREIRYRIGALLARLSNPARPPDAGVQGNFLLTRDGLVDHLRCLQAGCTPTNLDTVAPKAVGYGSFVELQDLETGETTKHHLMSSEAMDLDANHVSIESPLGTALLGRRSRAVVGVVTPARTRRLRVVAVATLLGILDILEIQEADALAGADR